MPIVPPVPNPANWFVDVLVEEPSTIRTRYSIGPIASWSDARELAAKWEAEFGPDTTAVSCRNLDDPRYGNPGRPRATSV